MTENALISLLDATRLTGLTASREGGLVASLSHPNAKGDAYVGALAAIGDDGVVRLTRGEASASSPALTPDGHVLFLSRRVGEDGSEAKDGSLWSLPLRGEARQLATRPGGFAGLRVAGGTVVVEIEVHSQAADEAQHAELSAKRSAAKATGILHEGFPTRYWSSDLGPGRTVLATADAGDLDAPSARPAPKAEGDEPAPQPLSFRHALMPAGRLLAWDAAPDGSFAVATMRIQRAGGPDAQQVWRIDLRGAEPRLLIDADPADLVEFRSGHISPDGHRVVVERTRIWNAEQSLDSRELVVDVETGERTELWAEGDHWYDPVWLDDETLVSASDDTGRGSIWIGTATDAAPRRLAGGQGQELSFSSLDVCGGRLVAIASAVHVSPFPVAIDPGSGDVTALPNPADVVAGVGTTREVSATAEDGTALRAWLRVPEGDGPHPLVVFAHGGPWGSWNAWTYRWNPNPFVEAGYAVLLPDPAISTGYGQAMIDRGQHQLGGTPYTDILALTDAAIAEPDVDAERTAFAGGSYGGYMANWVAGHTGERFACIVTHASLWDMESMSRTTDNSGWDAPMRAQSALYSPHLSVADIRVPMLVIHGDKDYRVPIAQGQRLWYDLLTSSATPPAEDGTTRHRYLYFPDEGHWVLGRGNAELWYRAFVAFLDRHVLGVERDRPATLG